MRTRLSLLLLLTLALAPAAALAQATPAAAPASMPVWLSWALEHLTLPMVLSVVGAVAGYLHLDDRRKRWVALAVYHAFHAVEDINTECKEEGKALPWVDKATGGLAQADAYLVAHGWRPLKPGEQAAATITFRSLNAQTDAGLVPTVDALAAAGAANKALQ